MPTQDAKMKLTALLIADVKGYSRLMGEDEEWATQMLDSYKEILVALIHEYQGRLVNSVGDNLLAEFASAVDAVKCAVKMQKELKVRNEALPGNRRMEFRIGVNLGDVVEEGEKISGDGVNVTAKLESVASAGGICISGAVYDYVKNKAGVKYEYFGEQSVKNIEKPVRVYRVLMEPKGFLSRFSIWKGTAVRQWERLNPAVKVIIALVAVANGVWQIYPLLSGSPLQIFSKGKVVSSSSDKASKTAQPTTVEVASKEKMAFPLPDVPSIAVLPFVNMSEDPKQEFLSDGMTESIITALSKVRNILVISRQSTFSYKGKPVTVKQVSEELGVRFVLEGSVQRSGDRLRITAQLVDAITGHHLWAERYDREVKDIFALQDEITLKILTATQVKLTEGERSPSYGKYFRGKQGLDCYLKFEEGRKYAGSLNIVDNNLARRIAEEALAMCPEVPSVYFLMANVYANDYWLGSTKSRPESTEKGIEMAQKALALDDTYAEAHGLLGHLYSQKREYDKSIAEGERAVALNPSGATAIAWYALSLSYAGRSEEAIPWFQKAIRLNPHGPTFYYHNFGQALWLTGRFEEAVPQFKKVIQRVPNHNTAHMWLAITYSNLGREVEARAETEEHLRLNPKFTVESFAKTRVNKEQSEIDNIINALRKVGLK